MKSVTKQYVAIDWSSAYLLARMTYEGKLVIMDTWLTMEKIDRAAALYAEVGRNFNRYMADLKPFVLNPDILYKMAVRGLETFRDNLDEIWRYAYNTNQKEPENINFL